MYNFANFLLELSKTTGVSFKLVGDDGNVKFDSLKGDTDTKEEDIYIGKQKGKLIISKKYEICTSLLKYSIQTKFKEIHALREQIIVDILEGKGVSTEFLYGALSFLSDKCSMIVVSVNNNKYEALNIIREYYNKEEIIAMIYKECIVVIGDLEDVGEHAIGIKELISSNLYINSYIFYSEVANGLSSLKTVFDNGLTCINLGVKFGLKNTVYDNESLLFEKAIFNINEETKNEIYEKFKDKFLKFDSEMVNTIVELMNCGLNISEASKKLYIHRNTLIYRLDKVQKDTGYDVRDFRQATIFMIGFLIWRERRS